MPKELDEIEEMDVESSTTSEDELTAVADDAAEASAADSSNATDETEADTLSVVRDVVAEREPEPAEAASSAEGEEGTEDNDDSQERDPDDYSDVPFHTHPRFKQVVAEKNANREDATRYRNVQAFIEQNHLSGDEVATGFEIMALMKSDPQAAWGKLKPLVQDVLIAAGEILPDDLAQRVAKKEITKDVALELSRTRAAEKARGFRETLQQQSGERRQAQEASQTLVDTAQNWLNGRRLKDPNFAAKEARLHREIAFLHATEGKPKDAAGVTAQLKKAYATVNSEFSAPAAAAPKPGAPAARPAAKPAIKPVTGGSVANAPPAKPKNTMDVIQRVVGQRQSA